MVFLILCVFLIQSESISDRIDYSEYELDSPIKEVYFCGENHQIFLILTTELSVYRSENQGFSWKSLNSIMDREGQKGTRDNTGKVSKVVISQADPNLVAFMGTTGINWYSEDCGKTINALNHGIPMEEFRFHPTVPEWCLAAAWKKCSDFGTENCSRSRGLFVTKDLGKTWKLVTDYVVQFAWGYDGLSKETRKKLPKERIYMTRMKDQTTDEVSIGWSSEIDFLLTDDFFSTFSIPVARGNKFLLEDQYILVAEAVENSNEVQLMVATGYDIENFYKAELPVKGLTDHSYTLLDTSEASIFININHKLPYSNYGNVYISDFSGRRFSLSLLRNIRNSQGICDFHPVEGIEGIYIANIFDENFVNLEEEMYQNKQKNRKETLENVYKKSVISFDKGGEWKKISPPDSENKHVLCPDEDCSLHLHGLTSTGIPTTYSNSNAIGIILATGNIGYHLSYEPDQINLFMSRDGGFSWEELKKGSYTYEIGDHGALLVISDNTQLTSSIEFSWNEGLSWESLEFTPTPLNVENIIIKPGSTSQLFLLIGERDGKGVTVAFDFSSLHEPECRYPEDPGSSMSDYEIWSPYTNLPLNSCLMGRETEYVRKKREAECFNGEVLERQHVVKNCECNSADFECDLGFYREGHRCKEIEGYSERPDECLQGYSHYELVTGYRRVPGNSCVGGISEELEPLKVKCPDKSVGRTGYMVLAVMMVAVILIIFTRFSESFERKLAEFRGLEIFDRTGYSTDLTRAPEGMFNEKFEELDEEIKLSIVRETKDFNSRNE